MKEFSADGDDLAAVFSSKNVIMGKERVACSSYFWRN
jgi:hypothetical protein